MLSISKKSNDDKLAGVASIPFFFLSHWNSYFVSISLGTEDKIRNTMYILTLLQYTMTLLQGPKDSVLPTLQ